MIIVVLRSRKENLDKKNNNNHGNFVRLILNKLFKNYHKSRLLEFHKEILFLCLFKF